MKSLASGSSPGTPQNWLILKNGNHVIGLFQGMFEKNILTFNPGWDSTAQKLASYSVAAHSIAQRTHEIGVRLAVGAAPVEVRLMLLRQNIVPVAMGVMAGIAASAGLERVIGHLIPHAQPMGVWMSAAAALVIISAATTAAWTASRPVTHIDPMSALRAE